MEERINIDELISKYTSFNSKDAKRNYLVKTVKTVDYVPFLTVCVSADQILRASSYDKNGHIKIDSCKRYLMYVFVILSAYTNINVDEKDFTNQFDKLNRTKLLKEIIALIDPDLIDTLDSVLKMKTDDFMTNYYDIHSYVNRLVQNNLEQISPVVTKIVDIIDDYIKNINLNDLIQSLKIDK